jgi:hypothetical protein
MRTIIIYLTIATFLLVSPSNCLAQLVHIDTFVTNANVMEGGSTTITFYWQNNNSIFPIYVYGFSSNISEIWAEADDHGVLRLGADQFPSHVIYYPFGYYDFQPGRPVVEVLPGGIFADSVSIYAVDEGSSIDSNDPPPRIAEKVFITDTLLYQDQTIFGAYNTSSNSVPIRINLVEGVPEPSTTLLLSTGIALLAGLQRKKLSEQI